MSNQQYDNNLRGALWKNDKKHPKAPDFSGHCEIDGVKYHVDMWDTEKDRPSPYYSIKLQNFDEWQAERERYKQGRGGDQSRTRAAQVDRPRDERRPPLQREEPPPFEDSDVPW